eukprot:c7302_g1_i2.p1 GENE.c7302_g1_i2~~c7302_g1_i2.p1  ORF type:complete len:469 (+),score=143.67 c7302_g1_i2:39-1445(+)
MSASESTPTPAKEEKKSWADEPDDALEKITLTDTGNEKDDELPIPSLVKELHPADQDAEVQIVGTNDDQGTKDTHLVSNEIKTFEDLHLPEALLKAVYEMKYQKPSKIQGQTLPHILQGENVIGQAQTGSGKTACFVLGMLNKLDTTKQVTQGICLGPSRELVHQLHRVAGELGKFMPGLTTTVAIPEASLPNQILRQHLVFGTPGRVLTLLQKRLLSFDSIRVCAVDEADMMVDAQGLGDQTLRIFRAVPKAAQKLLFSATFGIEVMKFVEKLVPPPRKEVVVKRSELSLDGIKQFYVECNSKEAKFNVLDDIFGLLTIGQTLIFANRREDADALKNDLQRKGHSVTSLHGKLEPQDRDKAMDNFRSGRTKVLIATNVLARGIDILQVTLTVNYDVPMTDGKPDFDTYLHRSGRTARFGRKGITLNMVDNHVTKKALEAIARHWGKVVEELKLTELEEKLGAALKHL